MSNLFEASGVALNSGPDWSVEAQWLSKGHKYVCGVDEVGRGPLAGPVVAAAVILDADNIPVGLNDSKKLSFRKRQALDTTIKEKAISFAIAEASVEEIDTINILQASMLAMRRAVAKLEPTAHAVLVDGNRDPAIGLPTELLVKGDARSLSIAAASILAKNFRDDLMKKLGGKYPEYGWETNAGYGVPKHLEALKLVGVSEFHRKSFAPIRYVLDEE